MLFSDRDKGRCAINVVNKSRKRPLVGDDHNLRCARTTPLSPMHVWVRAFCDEPMTGRTTRRVSLDMTLGDYLQQVFEGFDGPQPSLGSLEVRTDRRVGPLHAFHYDHPLGSVFDPEDVVRIQRDLMECLVLHVGFIRFDHIVVMVSGTAEFELDRLALKIPARQRLESVLLLCGIHDGNLARVRGLKPGAGLTDYAIAAIPADKYGFRRVSVTTA